MGYVDNNFLMKGFFMWSSLGHDGTARLLLNVKSFNFLMIIKICDLQERNDGDHSVCAYILH